LLQFLFNLKYFSASNLHFLSGKCLVGVARRLGESFFTYRAVYLRKLRGVAENRGKRGFIFGVGGEVPPYAGDSVQKNQEFSGNEQKPPFTQKSNSPQKHEKTKQSTHPRLR
jgi:hypothetical protein